MTNRDFAEIERVDWSRYEARGNVGQLPFELAALLLAGSPGEAACHHLDVASQTLTTHRVFSSAIPCVTCLLTEFGIASEFAKPYICDYLAALLKHQSGESAIVESCRREIERGLHLLFHEAIYGQAKNQIKALSVVLAFTKECDEVELLRRALWHLERLESLKNSGVEALNAADEIAFLSKRIVEIEAH